MVFSETRGAQRLVDTAVPTLADAERLARQFADHNSVPWQEVELKIK